jgi:hypothetical protein
MQHFYPTDIAWFRNGYGDRALYLVQLNECTNSDNYQKLDINNKKHVMSLEFIRSKYESFIKDIDKVLSYESK